jgi:hypothetical protein
MYINLERNIYKPTQLTSPCVRVDKESYGDFKDEQTAREWAAYKGIVRYTITELPLHEIIKVQT